jgi:tRNA-dihydrouridine synthase B
MLANIPLSSPTFFAPMQGVSTAGVRDLVAELGRPGIMCVPFVRVTAIRPSVKWLLSQVHRTSDIPLCAQLLGNHAEHLAFATSVLSHAGASVIDLNLGCPTARANKKGVGAALLSRVEHIGHIVESMRAACTCKLSVKIRASEGDFDDSERVARTIEAAGADFIVVHPRKRSQCYDGVADWGIVKRLKSSLRIAVVGNGDLWYAADAVRLMRESGADAVMLGRPALRNPFIFRQIEELCSGKTPYIPTGGDVVRHIERLAERARIDLAERERGPEGAVKEQIQFLLRAVPEPLRTEVWQSTMHALTLDEILSAILPLSGAPELDLAADGPLRFEKTPTLQ